MECSDIFLKMKKAFVSCEQAKEFQLSPLAKKKQKPKESYNF
jgi:hypothetical protein